MLALAFIRPAISRISPPSQQPPHLRQSSYQPTWQPRHFSTFDKAHAKTFGIKKLPVELPGVKSTRIPPASAVVCEIPLCATQMDAAPGPVESTERALSSEPYSTRPNPFDDSDQSSRKRRRTSLSGASTSRSLESPAADDESAMKIETDPTTPQNPELLDEQPAAAVVRPPLTAEHSSRVTINVRTPSRRQDNTHLSPTSPETLVSTATNANAMLPDLDEEVKISVEDSGDEAALQDGVDGNTPQTITSDSDGPSFVALEPTLDDGFDPNRAAILSSHDLRDRILVDPLSTFPYCDKEEACPESVSQLTQFLPTHEGVGNELAKWVERSLAYFQATPRDEMHRSIQRHFDFWAQVPELVSSMLAPK